MSLMHIDLRYMGMCKTLKVYIFVIENDTDIIQISYSLDIVSFHLIPCTLCLFNVEI